jgi:hypothetical protein
MLPVPVKKYLDSRGITTPWSIDGLDGGDGFYGAVVIPSLAESSCLFATLESLARNPVDLLSRFLILVVVNHRADASTGDKADNLRTLQCLKESQASLAPLRLAWVDAASAGKELPEKGGGVGLSRKIGFDLALPRLSYGSLEPILVALDADTLVQPDYLAALVSHFGTSRAGGAVISFRHQEDGTAGQRDAIRRYELFLRYYVLGLSLAGSPYAFHTVGSAMACTSGAYVRAGGMNSRIAAEDFYFLQQLHRTSSVAQVAGTIVYPSARVSHRVPFGTGRSVGRLLAEEEGAVMFYHPECFQVLGEWLALVVRNMDASGEELLLASTKISPHLRDYLHGTGFVDIWEKLLRTNHHPLRRLAAFHCWFDGLKTMKLIHHLSAGPYLRCEPWQIMPRFFQRAGLKLVEGVDNQLALLRKLQIGVEC